MKLSIIYLIFILSFIIINPICAEVSNPNKISLTLIDAISMALKRNTVIKGSGYSVQGAVLIKSAAESEFDLSVTPSIKAGLGSSEGAGAGVGLSKKLLTGTTISVAPGFRKDKAGYNSEISAGITQPILRGLGVFSNSDKIDSSEYSLKTARLAMYQTKTSVAIDTIKTAYNAARYKETITLYKSLISRLEGYIKTGKIKEEVGLATPMDVFRAEISHKEAGSALAEENELYENTINRLKIILALPLETDIYVLTPMDIEPFIITEREAIDIALKNNVIIKQAGLEIDEAKRRSDLARHNLLPRLDLVADYTRYGISNSFSLPNEFNQERFGVMLSASTDISRKQENTAYQLSMMRVDSLNIDLAAKKDELTRQVLKQRYALKKAEELMVIKTELIRHAKGKLALAKLKFEHAMADNFDLISSETELNTAEVGLLSSKIDYISAIYDMRAVLGTLIEYE
jgi:outer membrane protein TolC